jgi:hypothetical protein
MTFLAGGRVFIQKAIKKVSCLTVAVVSMIRNVLPLLRIIGIANAALWFGATLLFLICIRSGFQSPEMVELIPEPFAAAAMHVLLKHYIDLILLCALVALFQLCAIQWYQGRPIFRLRIGILIFLIIISALLKWNIYPMMQKHHLKAHQAGASNEDQRQGSKAYRTWKTGFYFLHLIILGGSLSHLLHVSNGANGYRELRAQQFRG